MLTFYFDDTFVIEQLDPDGKKFDKVSRIVARSEKHGALLHLDVNTEIYPMGVKEKFLMVLSPTLNYSGAPITNEAQVEQKSLADKFEYIMYGLLYKMDHMRSESSDGGSKSPPLVEVYVSFGGLQMRLRADPNSCGKFKVDQNMFLLIRKLM
ncbi:PREDICTED: DNA-directed RNA polymerases I, II, and III subunit rpabc3-like [Fragaria vesca subsp. vesca]|uniref:DNA-directed RNA polymerases II and V subunit 8A-like n=1 Tax=Fragaria vesca subsp. vesca TaxID=101020 RepID=UPI0002C36997|nr:PREDICTED: DNA-directed RNA polymerases II and V subunit 8A-like [Fragaria vesca subsp. vesca]